MNRLEADALLLAKHGVDGVYDHNPRTHPGAVRYTNLSHRQAPVQDVQVMDTTALVLVAEHHLTMHVFDAATDAMRAICQDQDIGTRIRDYADRRPPTADRRPPTADRRPVEP
ncbi:amino acid kinase family protein [Kitasatospora sp. NPDC001132]